ncbi:hypothetical protein CCACVL1_00964, partial [Corchorus capsularis]
TAMKPLTVCNTITGNGTGYMTLGVSLLAIQSIKNRYKWSVFDAIFNMKKTTKNVFD